MPLLVIECRVPVLIVERAHVLAAAAIVIVGHLDQRGRCIVAREPPDPIMQVPAHLQCVEAPGQKGHHCHQIGSHVQHALEADAVATTHLVRRHELIQLLAAPKLPQHRVECARELVPNALLAGRQCGGQRPPGAVGHRRHRSVREPHVRRLSAQLRERRLDLHAMRDAIKCNQMLSDAIQR